MTRSTSKLDDKKLRPFLRWAGSKRLLLKHLIPLLPDQIGTYYEPFLGSGSVYLHLKPKRARLNDKALEVIDLLRALRTDVEAVLSHVEIFTNDKDTYYRVRNERSEDPLRHAAEFLFLNRTCWNGLFRVNLSGNFNVPYGNNKVLEIVDAENLRLCARFLNETKPVLTTIDFESAVVGYKEGDFAYFDPPYVTGHNNNGFLAYNEKIFSWDDQIRLSKLAKKLFNEGVQVMVSNANHEDVCKLYPDFVKTVVNRHSTISGSSDKRGPITEVIFTTPKQHNNDTAN